MILTPDQLATIDRHLRKENWLLNEDLITELTDHYVAGLEDRMARGVAFDAALREVYAGFGWRKGLLKMEEEYQMQKARRLMLDEWREVRAFFLGRRLAVTLGVFLTLYVLNTIAGQQEMVKSFFITGEFFMLITMSVAIVIGMVQGWMVLKQHGATTGLYFNRISAPFVRLYALCYLCLFSSKFLAPTLTPNLPEQVLWSIDSLTQTLTMVYFMGILIALRKQFFNKVRPA